MEMEKINPVNEESVQVRSKKKTKKKRLFNLASMDELVKNNSFLESKYDKLAVNAEEKLGYHWNEVIMNIIFNKYVKTDEDLMDKYKIIKNNIDAIKEREKAETDTVKNHPALMQEPISGETETTEVVPNINEETSAAGIQTGESGSGYAYETPSAFFKGTPEQFLQAWKKRNKHLGKETMQIIKPNTDTHIMGKNAFTKLNENLLTDPNAVENLFESMFKDLLSENDEHQELKNDLSWVDSDLEDELTMQTHAGNEESNDEHIQRLFAEKKRIEDEIAKHNASKINEEAGHPAMTQLDKIKKDNQKYENGYFKSQNKGTQDMIAGKEGAEFKYDYDKKDSALKNDDVPKSRNTDEDNEFIELNHGQSLLDFVQKVEHGMTDDFKKKMENQAGKENVDKAFKKKEIREKTRPELPAPMRVEIVKEGVQMNASYQTSSFKKNLLAFYPEDVKEIESINENHISLETKGLGNLFNEETKTLVENYSFYLNKENGEISKKKKDNLLNESYSIVDRKAIDTMHHLMNYSPKKWYTGKK